MSKSNKHTKGPWYLDGLKVRADRSYRSHNSQEKFIAEAFTEDNAHLIAASPDLLDALEKLLHDTTSLCHSTDEADFPLELAEYWTSYMEPLLKKAIAKAKGCQS